MIKLRLLVVLFCLFTACTKEKQNPDISTIAGQWAWFKSTGGIANITITPQNSGHSWNLLLNNDLSCFQDGDLFPAGPASYILTEEGNSQYLNINSPSQNSKYNYSFISIDTLRLDDHIEVDGLSHFLVRVE